MDIFEYAMQMEKDGERFYRDLADKANDKAVRSISTKLADDEVLHFQALSKIREGEFTMADTTILEDAKNIFEQLKDTPGRFDYPMEYMDLYKQALKIEEASRDFYLEKADEAAEPYQKAEMRSI